ncbi:hypothetical protein [Circovirus-like genome DCCV-7]|uniref:hypothetical protein n=1 Tax=Circovirus-like genome DCCV-7 TaxID=1788447 RepID=UPI0007F9D194|nr:hypothetical protein [Circovirus-like genome DCCV-7]AMB42973.1 hypothetical protein [Circovirus-like genome DCCV-7]
MRAFLMVSHPELLEKLAVPILFLLNVCMIRCLLHPILLVSMEDWALTFFPKKKCLKVKPILLLELRRPWLIGLQWYPRVRSVLKRQRQLRSHHGYVNKLNKCWLVSKHEVHLLPSRMDLWVP